MSADLQWGGRFETPPDPVLLAFGSSLADDLVLATHDVRTSIAHVAALEGGGIIGTARAEALRRALRMVGDEIADGRFERAARAAGAEDVHGAIDARVRAIEPEHGAWLHAGRSRNDQVATTLLLYAAEGARRGRAAAIAIARLLLSRARDELAAGTPMAATTHMQPAQPVLLAFWLEAAAEMFARAARRFLASAQAAMRDCPLGSGAVAGSSLPLDRAAAAAALGFARPSRSALDAIGTRDAALDVAHAFMRAGLDASRVAGELVLWATPGFGYVRLGDASSTGSSLMPQKRNPDVFELVRGHGGSALGLYAGACATLAGLPLSYHRDLQETKRLALQAIERGGAVLDAFHRALADTAFDRGACAAQAGSGFAVATDMADALIAAGTSPREAHRTIGARVRAAERAGEVLPMPVAESIAGKATAGSTAPGAVAAAIAGLAAELDALDAEPAA